MSTVAEVQDSRGLSSGEVDFIGKVLTANANWSAGIHTAALDGQERAANEWAQRYLTLVNRLDFILDDTHWSERNSDVFSRLARLVGSQGFYPTHAEEQTERYAERLAERQAAEKKEKEGQ